MQNSRQDDLSSTETDPEVTQVMELVDESIDDHYAKSLDSVFKCRLEARLAMVEMQKVSFKRHKFGLPWQLSSKGPTCQCRRYGFRPWSGKTPQAPEQLSLCTAIDPAL